MLKSLLFFTPDDQAARNAVRILHRLRVDSHLIGLVANAGTQLDEISMDDECKTWESLEVLQRSILLGGAPGNFAGLHAVNLPLVSVTLVGAAIFAADFARSGIDSVLRHALDRSLSTEQVIGYSQKLARGECILSVRLNVSHEAVFEGMLRRWEPMILRESVMPAT